MITVTMKGLDATTLTINSVELLEKLVSFDTTSSKSNIEMIEFITAKLVGMGVECRTIYNADKSKANLLAAIGPAVAGGIVLSGHTDVVPCDGQEWCTDPFRLTSSGERLVGRGTADMKTFIACATAATQCFAARGIQRPVYFAWSYDEEVGCLGAPAMIEAIRTELPELGAAIVGEPTNMNLVSGHKGVRIYSVRVRGFEAHSSLADVGLSANMIGAQLMAQLLEIERKLIATAEANSPFRPPYATLNIGKISGGTAVNILAGHCTFSFDLRCPPGTDPDRIMVPFDKLVEDLNKRIRSRFPECGIDVSIDANVPSFSPEPEGYATELGRWLTGDNGPIRVVPFGSEAGQFQEAGISTVICGPGSIEQAHQPNEYVTRDQVSACSKLMLRIGDSLA
jgi:acetylornithine deacetylase